MIWLEHRQNDPAAPRIKSAVKEYMFITDKLIQALQARVVQLNCEEFQASLYHRVLDNDFKK
jgi:hypothetical protein